MASPFYIASIFVDELIRGHIPDDMDMLLALLTPEEQDICLEYARMLYRILMARQYARVRDPVS